MKTDLHWGCAVLFCLVLQAMGLGNRCVGQSANSDETSKVNESRPRDTSSEPAEVTIRLIAPTLGSSQPVFLAGNIPALGNWNPGHTKMSHSDNGWTHSFKVPPGTKLEYKFTLGSWQKEAAQANGRPLQNFRLPVEQSIVQTHTIENWTQIGTPQKLAEAPVAGEVRYHRDVEFRSLRPRDLVVWLPPDYDDSDQHYGVLYMHDGQNIFDPRTSAFGVDWRVDETMTSMIQNRQVDPLIVVGIYNTSNRSKEYLVGPMAEQYLDFVAKGIKPLIDSHYRTRIEREYTYAAGSSAGGLAAFRLAWERPETFSAAICMSPAFSYTKASGERSLDYVSTLRTLPRPDQPITLYLDCGGLGVDARLLAGITETIEVLKEKGLAMDQDLRWVHDEKAPHNEKAWGVRFPQAIQWLDANRPR